MNTVRDSAAFYTAEALCERCQRSLNSAVYEVRVRGERSSRCLRCALTHGPLMVRSFLICLGVGTLLVAINQGNVILRGDASMALAWKIPLTYAVPYSVATVGAILNSRLKPARGDAGSAGAIQ